MATQSRRRGGRSSLRKVAPAPVDIMAEVGKMLATEKAAPDRLEKRAERVLAQAVRLALVGESGGYRIF